VASSARGWVESDVRQDDLTPASLWHVGTCARVRCSDDNQHPKRPRSGLRPVSAISLIVQYQSRPLMPPGPICVIPHSPQISVLAVTRDIGLLAMMGELGVHLGPHLRDVCSKRRMQDRMARVTAATTPPRHRHAARCYRYRDRGFWNDSANANAATGTSPSSCP
jgi:hypothetical protein